jgi:hypothetical protein
LYLLFQRDSFGVSNVFMVVFFNEHEQLPPCQHH